MHIKASRHVCLDCIEELAEFGSAMTWIALADDLSGGDVKRRKQRCRLRDGKLCRAVPSQIVIQRTADGAYDGARTYQTIAARDDEIEVAMIAEQGRLAWQSATGYGRRSLVETTMGRYKALIGPRLHARGFAVQRTEAAVGVAVLNRMLATGRPDSVRRQAVTA